MVALGFLVLQCNPNPLLVWRKTPLWVGCIFALHLGPVAPAFGMQFGKKRLIWKRCWCCSALLPGSPQVIVQWSLR